MNLQQLRYLVSVADSGSVSGAARALHVSQPVVSRALHDLERQYSLVMFRRSGRRLVLTEAGLSIVASARKALGALDDVDKTARELAFGAELALVATPTNSTLLSPVVTSFVRHDPSAALRLRRAASMEEVFAMVRSGQADLGFGDLPEEGCRGLSASGLWRCEVVIVSPPGSRLPPALGFEDLASSGLVLPPEGSDRRRLIDEFILRKGGRPSQPALVTDERAAWIASAQQGIGSFISYRSVAAEIEGVECRPLDPPHWVAVGFVHLPKSLSRAGREMLQIAFDCDVPAGCERV
jgi:DNA-binding transcriptional LysR family regulator